MNDLSKESQKRTLRIAIVTDTYVPDINGVAISLGRLASGLRDMGHQVEIIRSGKSHGEAESTVFSWPLPGYWEIKVGAPWPGEIRRRWAKIRPDVVYIAIETPLGFSAAAAALKLGIPIIGGFHTNFSEYLVKYGFGWVGKPVSAYQKWFHSRFFCTLVPSPDMLVMLESEGFQNVEILGRGVDTGLFHPAKRSPALRKEWGANVDTPVALVVGRVSGEKNIDLALRAFAKMREVRPDLVAVVIGNGPICRRLARENPDVCFPGYFLGEKLAEAYASADMMLFPSETETFGNVTLEAMASGLPVVAFDYAAAGWHGTDGVDCLKVPLRDEAAFLDASCSLIEAGARETIGAKARKTAESIGWSAIVQRFASLLQKAATHH